MRCITNVNDSKEEFFMTTQKRMSTETMVMGAVLSAIVIVLQFLSVLVSRALIASGAAITSITLVLVPVIIGAATCGRGMGAWLGFVFGFSVLISGASEPFFSFNPLGTIVTVLVKGTACGYFAGLAYKAIEKHNRYIAVAVASVVCPLVNTGIFFIGCLVFFMPTITEWAIAAELGDNIILYMLVGLAGINFLVELITNIILNPIITRLLNYRKKA